MAEGWFQRVSGDLISLGLGIVLEKLDNSKEQKQNKEDDVM